MNIFVTSDNPYLCAIALDDKRLVKMVLETAQLLSTALRYKGVDDPVLYKSTHVNHPCSVWVRQHITNYNWLVEHFWSLCEEYSYRFKRSHACESRFLNTFKPSWWGSPAEFVNCTPYKDLPVFEAYRKTLVEKWNHDEANGRPAKWTNTQPTPWG